MIERGCLERSHLRDLACQAAGSLREIPYPCCGDYLRGFFSILSSPGSLRFHPENRAVLQRLGSFSKLGFLAVTSHPLRASREKKKSTYFDNYSVFADSRAFFVPGGGYYATPSWKCEVFARIAFLGWFF